MTLPVLLSFFPLKLPWLRLLAAGWLRLGILPHTASADRLVLLQHVLPPVVRESDLPYIFC